MKTFNIWKTITLGLYNDADFYRSAIKKLGFKINGRANDILGKSAFTVAPVKETVDLVVVSDADLGFKNRATYKEICDAALNQGLSLVPAEVGPALRLQYKDQPKDEWLLIATESITGSDGNPCIFSVARNNDDVWLSVSDEHYVNNWIGESPFVFCLRK